MDRYDVYKESGISWIGAIPANWNVVGLSQLGAQRKQKNVDGSTTNVLSLSYGKIKRRVLDNSGLLPESFNTYNVIQPGDVVLRLTDLQNDQNSLRVGQSDEAGIITSAYCTLKPKCYSRYLYYLLASFDYKKGFYGLAGGVRQSLTFETIRSLKFILPSEKEQEIICSYLDGFVINIDNLLRPLEQSITLLREYRQSIITEAVTHGLDPNAPMIPSGKAWIGETPQSWKVMPWKYIAKVEANLVSPEDYKELPQVAPANIEKNTGKLTGVQNAFDAGVESDNHLFRKGAILYSKVRPALNKVAIAPFDGLCSADMYPISTDQNVKWLVYYMLSATFTEQVSVSTNRVKMPKLNKEELGKMDVVLPPKEDQDAVVNYLDTKTAEIDALIASKERQVELLREYRKSIIFEAVTGKFKVPGLE